MPFLYNKGMSAEEITLENLTAGVLANSANEFCGDCRDLRKLGVDVIDELPPSEAIDPRIVVGRFAGFAALCERDSPIPTPECGPGGCGIIQDERKCLLRELIEMTPAERVAKVAELAGVELSTD